MNIQRALYRGVIVDDTDIERDYSYIGQETQAKNLLAVCIFKYKSEFFVYVESNGGDIDINRIFSNIKVERWIKMYRIFHYVPDVSVEKWIRSRRPEQPIMQLVKLKDDMVASYIFYHYQYQEEDTGARNKHGYIGINENLLAFYLEEPTVLFDPQIKGKLDTHNTPPTSEEWGSLMQLHFVPLSDDVKNWLRIDEVKSFYAIEG